MTFEKVYSDWQKEMEKVEGEAANLYTMRQTIDYILEYIKIQRDLERNEPGRMYYAG